MDGWAVGSWVNCWDRITYRLCVSKDNTNPSGSPSPQPGVQMEEPEAERQTDVLSGATATEVQLISAKLSLILWLHSSSLPCNSCCLQGWLLWAYEESWEKAFTVSRLSQCFRYRYPYIYLHIYAYIYGEDGFKQLAFTSMEVAEFKNLWPAGILEIQ